MHFFIGKCKNDEMSIEENYTQDICKGCLVRKILFKLSSL